MRFSSKINTIVPEQFQNLGFSLLESKDAEGVEHHDHDDERGDVSDADFEIPLERRIGFKESFGPLFEVREGFFKSPPPPNEDHSSEPPERDEDIEAEEKEEIEEVFSKKGEFFPRAKGERAGKGDNKDGKGCNKNRAPTGPFPCVHKIGDEGLHGRNLGGEGR